MVDLSMSCTLLHGHAHRPRRNCPGTEGGYTGKSNRLAPVNPRPPNESKEASECKTSASTKRAAPPNYAKDMIFLGPSE